MKSLVPIIFFIILLSTSCMEESNVNFVNALPENSKVLSVIPEKYHGTYISSSIDEKIFITENTVSRMISSYDIVGIEEVRNTLDESFRGQDTVINYGDVIKFNIQKWGDEFKVSTTFIYDLFSVSSSNQVRPFKNSLLLNIKKGDFWEIKFLSLKGDNLKLKSLLSDEDLIEFNKETKASRNLVVDFANDQSVLDPSRKDLKSIVNFNNDLGEEYFKIGAEFSSTNTVHERFTKRYLKKNVKKK